MKKLILPVLLMTLISGCNLYSQDTTPPTLEPETETQTPATEIQTASSTITISNFAFSPSTLTVKVGDTVTWQHNDKITHTILASDGSFASSNMERGGTFTHTFDKAGTYEYYCGVHPSMRGKIIVQ